MNSGTILDLIFAAHRHLETMESTPRDYGLGEWLYPGDIHTIVGVAEHEGCNLTELAGALEISVPAAFKSAGKMVKLGYLEKKRRPGNGKEVTFYLTGKGRQAVSHHDAYRHVAFGKLAAIEDGLPEHERAVIRNFLEKLVEAVK